VTATTRHYRFLVNLTEARKIAHFTQTAKARDGVFQEIRTVARKSNETKALWAVCGFSRRRIADQHLRKIA